jgi:hypothetical protein
MTTTGLPVAINMTGSLTANALVIISLVIVLTLVRAGCGPLL